MEKFNLDISKEECQQLVLKYDLKDNGRFAYCDFLQSCILLLKAKETSLMQRLKIQNAHKMVWKPCKGALTFPQSVTHVNHLASHKRWTHGFGDSGRGPLPVRPHLPNVSGLTATSSDLLCEHTGCVITPWDVCVYMHLCISRLYDMCVHTHTVHSTMLCCPSSSLKGLTHLSLT